MSMIWLFPLLYLILFFVLLLFVFKNTLFYSMNLLVIVFSSLLFMFSFNSISLLTIYMFLIVYLGAMMVLIGYICAICPNLNLEPDLTYKWMLWGLLIIFILFSNYNLTFVNMGQVMSSDCLYSIYGLFLFCVIIIMLFITLLMATSIFMSSKCFFRSLL